MRISILYKIASVLISIVSYLIMIGAFLNVVKFGFQPMIIFMFLITLAVVIYVTLCFKLSRIIDYKQTLQQRTKDWIKVNGFVGLAFCALMLIGAINFLSNPDMINKIFTQVANKMQDFRDIDLLKNIFHSIVVVMLVYAILLTIHIITSLIYISRYNRLQKNETSNSI